MKVTGWTTFSDDRYIDETEMTEDEYQEARKTVIEEVRNKGYKFNGYYHQNGYAPVIDDKYIFTCTYRGWGMIMQEAYDLPNEDGFGYCIWAWSAPNDETIILPKELDYE